MNHRYIAIEGIIGAGKTTLSHLLRDKYNGRLLLEQYEENPFLPLFYKDIARYSFPLEMSFLASRYHQLNEINGQIDLFGQPIIADFVFYKSLVFATQTLQSNELTLYRRIFDIMMKQLPKPDITIYINVSTQKALQNIEKRGREYEKTIDANYLSQLHHSYLQYFQQLNQHTIIILNAEKLNFIENPSHLEKVFSMLEMELAAGIHFF